jgi:hypothetical protein
MSDCFTDVRRSAPVERWSQLRYKDGQGGDRRLLLTGRDLIHGEQTPYY